jgi:hypothetical protein
MRGADIRLFKIARTHSADLAASPREDHTRLVRDALAAQRIAIPCGFLALLLGGILLGMGLFVVHVTDRPFNVLTRDANVSARQPNYYGALEYAQALMMTAAGSIAVFSSLFCRGQTLRLLFLGGVLSLLLAADNIYMIHEASWRFGFEEVYVFLFYALLLLLLIGTNLRRFLHTPFVLLGAALALFAGAVLFDNLGVPFGSSIAIEDSLEMFGICFWSIYFVWCSWAALCERQPPHASH